ncbi:guanylate cyclase [Desulfosarcina ovata subsp. sediminis]|uniref:Guanylate cyclase n=1 Tax=Desulfosarcina ovata subsp. sediminis TaxID=885957 RepID=A0A5K7ZMS6_9BACT|nr:adenylate/guanylate cyclase domain-containing protein [Desulfosarcina ovata]BBO81715.1 guanylate cyclase [Desulfosarcina ovata subsp. sediminis]
MRLNNGRWREVLTGVAVTVVMAGVYMVQPHFLTALNQKVYDSILALTTRPNTSGVPVIVDLDEQSLARFGQWPWPRYRVAILLEKIRRLGADVVGVDIIFAEPDRTSPREIQKNLRNDLSIAVDFTGLPDALMDYDQVLANRLAAGPFVLSYKFFAESADDLGSDCRIHPVSTAIVARAGTPQGIPLMFNPTSVVCNIPVLAEAAGASGFINIAVDSDGIYRKVPLVMKWKDAIYPNLALAVFMRTTGIDNLALKVDPHGLEALRIGPTTVPVDSRGNLLIHYRSASRAFPYYSAADVLEDNLPEGIFNAKAVFIGATAAGLKDYRATPLNAASPGVEVHATVLDNLLLGDFISRPDWVTGMEFIIVWLSGVLTIVWLLWARARWSVVGVILGGGIVWGGSILCFRNTGIFVSPLWPLITLSICFVLLTVLKFWREESEKRFFYTAFSRYVSGTVVDELVKSRRELSLDGQEKDVSVLFCDLRGFTDLSERLAPNQVSELLRTCFTPMTRSIINSGGTMDKFIGDSIMAFWNAPLDVPVHQAVAVGTALDMLDEMKRLNVSFKQDFGITLGVGIGIHSGLVRVGNMGSEDLFDYTVIGDNVNLASRLEALTKTYGLSLLVSETVRRACGTGFVFQEVDTVRVKGKQAPVTVYTVYRDHAEGPSAKELAKWDSMLALYKKGQFAAALAALAGLRQDHRDLQLYRIYTQRCREFATRPPGENWDPIFVLNSK